MDSIAKDSTKLGEKIWLCPVNKKKLIKGIEGTANQVAATKTASQVFLSANISLCFFSK